MRLRVGSYLKMGKWFKATRSLRCLHSAFQLQTWYTQHFKEFEVQEFDTATCIYIVGLHQFHKKEYHLWMPCDTHDASFPHMHLGFVNSCYLQKIEGGRVQEEEGNKGYYPYQLMHAGNSLYLPQLKSIRPMIDEVHLTPASITLQLQQNLFSR